jgi:hypothetical protein
MDVDEERSVRLSATKNINAIPRPAAIYQIKQLASLSANPLTAFSPIRQLIGTVPHSSSVVVGCIKLCACHPVPNYRVHNDPESVPPRHTAV